MVRPATFRKNEETAGNNHYQKDAEVDDVHDIALSEFDGMVDDLRVRVSASLSWTTIHPPTRPTPCSPTTG